MSKQKELAEKNESTEITTRSITSVADTKYLAEDLAKFIREQKLFHNIQGKEYVNVEGWQYAGTRLNILPRVEELNRMPATDDQGKEIRYQAKVTLIDIRTQLQYGSGFSICSNLEPSKKYYQEFAIASMAQTRAIGKAYRNILAWLIRAAGYEPTPAEEMDYITATPVHTDRPVQPIPEKLNNEKSHAELAKTEYVEPVVESEVKPVTINQKTQILLLLNHTTITKDEKEKMVAKLNTFDTVRGDQAIAKLKKVIKERSSDVETGEVAKGALIAEIDAAMQSELVSEEERAEIRAHINTGKWLASEATACLKMLKDRVKPVAA